jgi:Thermostable hemolysin
MAFLAVTRSAELRSAVEDEIRKVYWDRYAARLSSFPSVLLAEVSPSGVIECAAGIRFGFQELFSECYLDQPAEQALSHRFGRAVNRDGVVEVCNLVATTSGRSLSFIRRLIEFVEMADAEWALFTATRTLRRLLQRSGLHMTELTCAKRSQIDNPDDWGSYYEHDPRVVAVSQDMAFTCERPNCASNPIGLVGNA